MGRILRMGQNWRNWRNEENTVTWQNNARVIWQKHTRYLMIDDI